MGSGVAVAVSAGASEGAGGEGPALNLVFNPSGAFLPPDQEALEREYRAKLAEDYGIVFDHVFAIGPLMMMKFACKLTEKYSIPTTVSMNPIMIDGTGMCGGCRLTVGGEVKFACVDGPDFDGHQVDFDEVIARNATYREFEAERKRDHLCRLGGGALNG